MVPRLFAAVDKAIGEIRADYPLTSVDDEHAVRPESHFGSSLENPQEVHTGRAGEEGERGFGPLSADSSADEQLRRLWHIRRQREKDPEFKRLIATSVASEPRRWDDNWIEINEVLAGPLM